MSCVVKRLRNPYRLWVLNLLKKNTKPPGIYYFGMKDLKLENTPHRITYFGLQDS